MVHGSMKIIRNLLFVINFIFVICGIALIIVGALGTKKDMTHFLDNKYITVPYILIVLGSVIFVISFFGCWGAMQENHFMVMVFALLVFVLMMIELAGGIAAYFYKGEVEDFLRMNMNESLAQQREESVKIWNFIQYQFECCGIDGARDYMKLNLKIPNSCCKDNAPCTETDAFQGCFSQVLELVKGSITIIGGVAIGIAVVELLGCMFALCLAHAIKKDQERR
ncbi:23 kDa integral membrane protein-like [Parasteatoda tepidariorum]|uniref:23 kDa integral membrane protein-like n=1 Tax=Parasteatoda tepidariorum TaxID=114398 RepID=UPI00077F8E6A|nr:23 kDa integral membrane protein-like [Parasteatoda tepidariorum]